ncbi:hypothetical protein WJX72_000014 [[Myrmecia] bisecta]|uniref:F-box protein n=1 Tax=[Myrmecia] bisecta TaxID=41462 RepID=A0AAW1PBP0_9CHLO
MRKWSFSFRDKQRAVQLVCKRWHDLLCTSGSPGLWGSVQVYPNKFLDPPSFGWDTPPDINCDKVLGCLSWISKRIGGIDKLQVHTDLAGHGSEDGGISIDHGGVKALLFKQFFTCMLGFLAPARCPDLQLELVLTGGGVGGIRRSPLCDPALAPVLGAHLRRLHLGQVRVSEPELEFIAGLHSLRSLHVHCGEEFDPHTCGSIPNEDELEEFPDFISTLVQLETLTF